MKLLIVFLHWFNNIGRIERTGYLVCHIFLFMLIGLLSTVIIGLMRFIDINDNIPLITLIICGFIGLFCKVSISIARIHDVGLSGWWYLTFLFPIIGLIGEILLFILPGGKRSNRFGECP